MSSLFGFPSNVFHVSLLAVKSPVLANIIWYLFGMFNCTIRVTSIYSYYDNKLFYHCLRVWLERGKHFGKKLHLRCLTGLWIHLWSNWSVLAWMKQESKFEFTRSKTPADMWVWAHLKIRFNSLFNRVRNRGF